MGFACGGFVEGAWGGGQRGRGNPADKERPSKEGLKSSLGLTGV